MSVQNDRIREQTSCFRQCVSCGEGKGRERSPGQLLKPLAQEPQSSRKLGNRAVRPNGRHSQTRVHFGSRPRLRCSYTLGYVHIMITPTDT